MIHLRNFIMHFDEVDGGLSARDDIQAVFYLRARMGLNIRVSIGGLGGRLRETYVRIIQANHNHSIRRHLLNGIEIAYGVDGVDGAVNFPPGAVPTAVSALQLLHALLAPLT